jgi:hypothetical protein
MLSSTIVLSGKVVVENVMFSWWITDATKPRITVSHPLHGTQTRPVAHGDPRSQARAIGRAMLGRPAQPIPKESAPATAPNPDPTVTVVLGEDYRRAVAAACKGDD